MKELSIEQKAKAYDEAVEKARKIHNEHRAQSFDVMLKIFPELNESEDDIRENCIAYIDGILEAAIEKNDKEEIVELRKILAWLEKQCETTDIEPVFSYNNLVTKKQDEQNPADTVEHKFEIGDWGVFNNKHQSIYQVEKIEDGYYILRHTHGGTFRVCVLHNESLRHWTIQDAKDGDVLIYSHQQHKWIFIFKRLYSPTIVLYYIMFIEKNKIYIDDSISTSSLSRITPATQEQRDFLFKKMKEAGYEWDVEKKELKKIENEIEIPFGAKDSELQESTYYIPSGFHAEIDGNNVVIKKGNQKSSWSEEDERIYKSITYSFANNYPLTVQQQEFIKSLIPQKLCIYNPYKAVVESIAKMCDKYKNCMCDEEKAKDFLTNIAVKCREAVEYDKKYMEE